MATSDCLAGDGSVVRPHAASGKTGGTIQACCAGSMCDAGDPMDAGTGPPGNKTKLTAPLTIAPHNAWTR